MPTLTITRGLPASGKTTWARQHCAESGAVRVNRDDLRAMLHGKDHGLTYVEETAVTVASHETVHALLKAGWDVVVDDMNLRPKYVRGWRDVAAACGAEIVVHRMPTTDVDVCVERDTGRGGKVGADAIRHLAAKFLPHGTYLPVTDTSKATAPAAYTPPPDAPAAVMVDIDGTIADRGTRSPYDWSHVSEDEPIDAVLDAVQASRLAGFRIVYLSGRDSVCRDDTRAWVEKHVGMSPRDLLLMRPEGDMRRDSVVKMELFEEHVRDRFDVRYVLDDRPSVIRMWVSLGLTVFDVNPSSGEF